jgi:hypothetical protein
MSNPVLFLDFDGVLNHADTTTRYMFPDGARFMGLDPVNVARLNAVCELVSDARIVVSSTWRTMLDVPALRSVLAQYGFAYTERVIDRTPVLHRLRGLEVQAWLDAQSEQPSSIAILDDAEDMCHLDPFLVRTRMWGGGLTDDDALATVEMLTTPFLRVAA